MSIQKQFGQFYESIKLTPSQREDAKKKYNGVCKKLHDHYYPDTDYTGDTKLLIGSYGKQTNIRPPRDVDVLFIMPYEKFKQYDEYVSNGQSQLLQDIKTILNDKYSTTDKIKGDGKVVLIQFSDGTHNIELLPAWEQEGGTFIIPNTEKGGYWETWNPSAEIHRIKDSDSTTSGKTRALIRMIKKWSENCSVKIKPFQIEDGVVNFLAWYDHDATDYSILARDFFESFQGSADQDSKTHLETAHTRASKACRFESEGKIKQATQEWKKIFGDDFPSSEAKIAERAELKPSLGDSSHCELLRWPLSRISKVHIDAYIYTENKTKKLGAINSDGRNLPPGLSLKFIAKTNAGNYFTHYWQVVNTGESARINNDLRGRIFEGTEVRWESTKYPGKHWIECFIVQDDLCIARSGKFFVNIR